MQRSPRVASDPTQQCQTQTVRGAMPEQPARRVSIGIASVRRSRSAFTLADRNCREREYSSEERRICRQVCAHTVAAQTCGQAFRCARVVSPLQEERRPGGGPMSKDDVVVSDAVGRRVVSAARSSVARGTVTYGRAGKQALPQLRRHRNGDRGPIGRAVSKRGEHPHPRNRARKTASGAVNNASV
jgi:hypothetical protein